MINRTLTTPIAAVAAALLALVPLAGAADQVATVTSSAQFHLRGAKVATDQGVPTWPVMAGDIVRAGGTPAAVAFGDGSTAVLGKGTLVKLERSGKTPVLQLICGTVNYSLKETGSVKLMSQNGPLVPAKLTGSFSMCSDHSAAGWWTAGHTALAMGGIGVGAAAWFGIAQAISGGDCVSPTTCSCASCACSSPIR